MGGAKRIIHVDVGQVCQRTTEGRVISFFLGVETQILKHDDRPGRKLVDLALNRRSHTIWSEMHRTTQQFPEERGHRFETESRCDYAPRTPKMRREQDGRTLGEGVLYGGQGFPDSCRIAYFLFRRFLSRRQGHVKINADQHALMCQGELLNCFECHALPLRQSRPYEGGTSG